MWNEAGLKLKPCCVFMKIHLRQSFAGTCLSQLVGAESFEGDASDFGKCFTPILRLRILRPSHQSSAKSIASSSFEAGKPETMKLYYLWNAYVGTVGVERCGFSIGSVGSSNQNRGL